MKGAIVHSRRAKVLNLAINHVLLHYFLVPLKAGLYGFAAFFTLIIAIKTVSSLLGYNEEFIVTTGDVLQSSLGFALVLIIRLAQNIKKLHSTASRNF
ncbi:MAG: hypothetical protein HKM87_07800 [Ignavibacteriaceae bacterium]|nr:hypothetical protein [Ignavibacteriaceae bacterium]